MGIDIGKNWFRVVGLDRRGVAVRQGWRFLRTELPGILAERSRAGSAERQPGVHDS